MISSKVKAEEVFEGVSDFRGALCADEQKKVNIPKRTEMKVPHWHDSCFSGMVATEKHVTVEELSSHF